MNTHATLLHVDASARATRSLTRRLSRRFVEAWAAANPRGTIVTRDLAAEPPPHLDEAWIGAAFTTAETRTEAQRRALAYSDRALAEVRAADVIVLGAPMYNYGMPSTLKAWFDHLVRVDETFSFDLARGDWPIEPLLDGKRLVVLSARGEFGFGAGGVRAGMNHLDPHLRTLAPFLGVRADAIDLVAIEYQEFEDARFAASVAAAEAAVDDLVRRLSASARQAA